MRSKNFYLNIFAYLQVLFFSGLIVYAFYLKFQFQRLLIFIPFLLWLFVSIGIQRQKYGYITVGAYFLILSFLHSIFLFIRNIDFFHAIAILFYGLFIFLCRHTILELKVIKKVSGMK